MYTKEDHFLIKLLTNNAMQLEETIEALSTKIKDLTESNDALYRNHNILKEKYDNAIAMLHGTESIKQEVVTQPELFQTLDKTTKSNDNTPHFKMQPTRRKLTTEQAQHAYNMITMGNATLTDMAKKFGCTTGTIGSLMYRNKDGKPVSYLEIDRSKQ